MVLGSDEFWSNELGFNLTSENRSFSISKSSRWRLPKFLPDGIIDKLKELLKVTTQNDIELHVEKIRKRRIKKIPRSFVIRF